MELPTSFVEMSSDKRTVGLVGAGSCMAFFDARRAFSVGVHDIGDLLFADPADARALIQLGNDRLLSRLQMLEHWSSGAFDACLRECARRGGPQIIAYLDQMERQVDWGTDIVLATARNRADRLADPLVLELVDDPDAPISCTISELPAVRLAFVNRDPLRRTFRLRCTEPECHDEGIAVECCAMDSGMDGFRLLRPSREGLRPSGVPYELAPGEEVVVSVRLSHYVRIESPGRYRVRFAFRMGGFWELDHRGSDLPRGVLFICSQPFVIDVSVSGTGDVRRTA
jgi:hypothetical protein